MHTWKNIYAKYIQLSVVKIYFAELSELCSNLLRTSLNRFECWYFEPDTNSSKYLGSVHIPGSWLIFQMWSFWNFPNWNGDKFLEFFQFGKLSKLTKLVKFYNFSSTRFFLFSQFSFSIVVTFVSSAFYIWTFVNFQNRNVSHSKILLFEILTLISVK